MERARKEKLPVYVIRIDPDNGQAFKTVVHNVPNFVTLNKVPYDMVTPNHRIIFVATS